MDNFVPNPESEELKIPYWEDASNADGVHGYTTTKSVKELKSLITGSFGRLGGSVTGFTEGNTKSLPKRYGYRISFTYNGVAGRITVFALPIRKETPTKVDKAKRHALISVHARLQAQYNTALVMPGDIPLMPWLLNKEGQTMTEYLTDIGSVPLLPAPEYNDIEEGEFEDV